MLAQARRNHPDEWPTIICGAAARCTAAQRSIDTVFAAEFIDATGRIENLLLAGVERMTNRTNVNMQLVRQGRLGYKFVAAATDDLDIVVLRMDVGFHRLAPGSEACHVEGRESIASGGKTRKRNPVIHIFCG